MMSSTYIMLTGCPLPYAITPFLFHSTSNAQMGLEGSISLLGGGGGGGLSPKQMCFRLGKSLVYQSVGRRSMKGRHE